MTAIKKTKQLYHASVFVTRAEEWCVEAETPEEATALLEAGQGYKCAPGDIYCIEFGELLSS